MNFGIGYVPTHDGLGPGSGVCVVIERDPITTAREVASAVRGKDITPFLLDHIHERSRHRSLDVNLEIVRSNCRLAAEIARAFSEEQA